MKLPVMPPVAPMLAKPTTSLPAGMHYEGKWDGFRAVIYRDGDEVEIGSRNERPLTRYFPDIVEVAKSALPNRCVVDGEIIINRAGKLDFDALLNRIHPADSRVTMLASETPASFVAFDMLALGNDNLCGTAFAHRRIALVEALPATDRVHVTPGTLDQAIAMRWFDDFEGAGLDGLIAKPLDANYEFGKRTMFKLKHARTADCVVAGFRYHKSGPVVGSLLLGLYDASGTLHQVGVAASFTAQRRRELIEELAPLRLPDGAEHPWIDEQNAATSQRRPGGETRWNAGKDLSWVPLRLELVVEVSYDHMQSGRFRHTAKFVRWRTDRDAASCTYDQLETPTSYDLSDVLSAH